MTDPEAPEEKPDTLDTGKWSLSSVLGELGETGDGVDPGPGHHLMCRGDLEAAVEAAGSSFVGDAEDVTSREEAARFKFLTHHRNNPEALFKQHVIGDAAMIERLAVLDAQTPNMRAVTGLIRRSATVSAQAGKPLRVVPLLLVGPPGAGKTHYARALAAALATRMEMIAGTTLAGAHALSGLDPSWRGAGPGRIAKALLASSSSGPIVIIDECEKIPWLTEKTPPLDRLLPLLDRVGARTYCDEYIQVPMRADLVTWILLANGTEGLSAPLRDRVITIHVEPIPPDGQAAVLQAMHGQVCAEHGIVLEPLSSPVIAGLRHLGLRRARLALGLALGAAVEAGRQALEPADIAAAAAMLGSPRGARRMGFIAREDAD